MLGIWPNSPVDGVVSGISGEFGFAPLLNLLKSLCDLNFMMVYL